MKILITLIIALVISAANISAQTTAFTYQGKLTVGGSAANVPHDFIFKLYTASTGGTQIGGDVFSHDVPMANGIFTVTLDFGTSPFTTVPAGNFLEILVRPGDQTGGYQQLFPRS